VLLILCFADLCDNSHSC